MGGWEKGVGADERTHRRRGGGEARMRRIRLWERWMQMMRMWLRRERRVSVGGG